MRRALASAAVLIAAAGMAAGCGSASWQASADKVGGEWGDSHPTIVRQQAVRLAPGTEAEIMQLRGHFRLSPTCGAVLGQAKCPSVVHLDTVVLAVNARDHELIEAGNDNTAPELAAFARAREARPMFRIFPEFSSPLVQCAIPSFGGRTVRGTCRTGVARTTRGEIEVALLEHWPLDGQTFRPYSGGWIVTVARSGRIFSVRRTGDLPPQLWTSANPLPPPPDSPLPIRRARREIRYLGNFPHFPGTKNCRFVEVNRRRPRIFAGTCTTKLTPRKDAPPVLAFIDHWRQGKRELTGGWIVTLRHDLSVRSIRSTGSKPPQSY